MLTVESVKNFDSLLNDVEHEKVMLTQAPNFVHSQYVLTGESNEMLQFYLSKNVNFGATTRLSGPIDFLLPYTTK